MCASYTYLNSYEVKDQHKLQYEIKTHKCDSAVMNNKHSLGMGRQAIYQNGSKIGSTISHSLNLAYSGPRFSRG